MHQTQKNVNDAERWASVVLGSALAGYGLKRRSLGGMFLGAVGGALVIRGAMGRCPLYTKLGVSTVREPYADNVSIPYGRGTRVEKSVTINAPATQLYEFWRRFDNLPRFMNNLESVEVLDDKRSRWTTRGPAGTSVSWEAEIINEVPNELIGWRSVEGSRVDNAGSVHFTPLPGNRGTELKVVLRYDPPAGVVGATLSKILGDDPAANVQEDLRRLKALVETGEVPTVKDQSTGRAR